jgi:hypothetical protein
MNTKLLNDTITDLLHSNSNLNLSSIQDKKTQNTDLKKIKIINRILELIKEYKILETVDKE